MGDPLRGLVAALFGIAMFMWHSIKLWAIAALFGSYALINGILALIESVRRNVRRERWSPLMFEGVIGIAIDSPGRD
ncbi:MAG: DUF308 domain-containing protein [Chloracidobacterium sp.]|nr:DUF308 domain-containing protein [Chloracidobacterium sp.]